MPAAVQSRARYGVAGPVYYKELPGTHGELIGATGDTTEPSKHRRRRPGNAFCGQTWSPGPPQGAFGLILRCEREAGLSSAVVVRSNCVGYRRFTVDPMKKGGFAEQTGRPARRRHLSGESISLNINTGDNYGSEVHGRRTIRPFDVHCLPGRAHHGVGRLNHPTVTGTRR